MLAQTLTAQPLNITELYNSLMPIVTLASLLYSGWKAIQHADTRKKLNAVILGVRAGLAYLNAEDAEAVKGKIEEAAGGKDSTLNKRLKADVKKTTSTMPVVDENGDPIK